MAPDTVPPPIPHLLRNREDPPLGKAPCVPPPSLGTGRCSPPLHQIRCTPSPTTLGVWPLDRPGPRCPGSRHRVAVARALPRGKPAATDDPELCAGASSRAPWRTLAPAKTSLATSAAVRGAHGAVVRPGAVCRPGVPKLGSGVRARAPLPAIMAAGASERSRRARSGSRLGARAAGAGRAETSAGRPLWVRGLQGAKQNVAGSPQRGTPCLARAGGRGRGSGARGRGAPRAACSRGRARGAAGRGAGPGWRIRCSRLPPRLRARASGGGCAAEGGVGEGPRPVLACSGHGRGPGRPRWYSRHSRSSDLPAKQGRPGSRARPSPLGGLPGLRGP